MGDVPTWARHFRVHAVDIIGEPGLSAPSRPPLGSPAYALSDDRRIPFFMLVNLLGGPGMNSRLNLAVREKHGLVYTIDANYDTYIDTGLLTIYFGTEKKQLKRTTSRVLKELKKLREEPLRLAALHVMTSLTGSALLALAVESGEMDAEAAWRASSGTVAQAERAHAIAELRYREGISTQLELNDARLLLQQAQANRARLRDGVEAGDAERIGERTCRQRLRQHAPQSCPGHAPRCALRIPRAKSPWRRAEARERYQPQGTQRSK